MSSSSVEYEHRCILDVGWVVRDTMVGYFLSWRPGDDVQIEIQIIDEYGWWEYEKNMGIILCHPSSPSMGVFTSGRVSGEAVRDDFGCTSIVIMITTTNADKVTDMSLSIMGQPYGVKIHGSPTALRMLSHLISSTSVRRSLTLTIALFKRVCNEKGHRELRLGLGN